jgi:hypothetical protein
MTRFSKRQGGWWQYLTYIESAAADTRQASRLILNSVHELTHKAKIGGFSAAETEFIIPIRAYGQPHLAFLSI